MDTTLEIVLSATMLDWVEVNNINPNANNHFINLVNRNNNKNDNHNK
ncbi:hypothetical protein QML37_31530 [Klebsiella pneumoniae]